MTRKLASADGHGGFSEQSRTDILDIWAQIVVRDRTIADSFFDRIEARCIQLADFTELGPQRRDISEGARVLVIDRWIIIYRTVDSGALIVRVIDVARDLTNLKLSDD